MSPFECLTSFCLADARRYDISGNNGSFPIRNVTFINVTMGTNGTPGVPMKQANCRAVDCNCDALTSPCPTCCTKERAIN